MDAQAAPEYRSMAATDGAETAPRRRSGAGSDPKQKRESAAGLTAARRWTARLAAFVVAMVAGVAAAALTAQASNLPLGPNDEITLVVFQQPDFSGPHTIDGLGVVSLPVVGPVQVGGLTVREAESALTAALSGGPLRSPFVVITAVKRDPVSVIGDVNTPGEYPYKDGMRVVRAVAAAGGYLRAFGDPARNPTRMTEQRERVATLFTRINSLTARSDRLTAELEGKPYDPPDDDPVMGSFIRAEKRIARNRAVAWDAALGSIESRRSTLLARIETIENVIELQDAELADFATEVDRRKQLAARQLSTSTSLMEMRFRQSQLKTEQMRNKVTLSQARQELDALTAEQATLEADRLSELVAERKEALEELSVLQTQSRFASLGAGGQVATRDGRISLGFTVTRELTILRETRAGLIEIPADEGASLRPGDVVRVRTVLRSQDDGDVADPDSTAESAASSKG